MQMVFIQNLISTGFMHVIIRAMILNITLYNALIINIAALFSNTNWRKATC